MRRFLNWRVLVLIVGAAAIVALFLFVPVQKHIERFLYWVQGLGVWGPILFAAVYVVACVFFIPGSLMTMGAGFAFGPVVGVITVSIASTLGASAAFWAGRTIARKWIEKKVRNNPRFQALDEAVAKEGFKIVLLTRLSPVFPFNLLNYAFGLTKVPFWKYFLASWIGMLPGGMMYIYIGASAKNLAELANPSRQKTIGEHIFFWGGLVVVVIVTLLATRIARRALAKKNDNSNNSAPTHLLFP